MPSPAKPRSGGAAGGVALLGAPALAGQRTILEAPQAAPGAPRPAGAGPPKAGSTISDLQMAAFMVFSPDGSVGGGARPPAEEKVVPSPMRSSSTRPIAAGGDDALEDSPFDPSSEAAGLGLSDGAAAAPEAAAGQGTAAAGTGASAGGAGGAGLPQKTVDMLADVIAERVEGVKPVTSQRSAWRSSPPRGGAGSPAATAAGTANTAAAAAAASACNAAANAAAVAAAAAAAAGTGTVPRGPGAGAGPGAAAAAGDGAKASSFGVSRLGIPSKAAPSLGAGGGGGASSPSAAAGGRPEREKGLSIGAAVPASSPSRAFGPGAYHAAARPADESTPRSGGAGGRGDRVRYIHIPKHAMKDFRDFARGVAAQACRDVATSNPYVQALNRHRAELQSPLMISDDPEDLGEQPTLEQQLSTKREALSVLATVGGVPSYPSAPSFVGTCGPEEAMRLKACGLFGSGAPFTAMQCCTSRGDMGDVVTPRVDGSAMGRQELVVHPTFGVGGDLSPPSAASLSARSALSTTCSRHSICEEAEPGGPGEGGSGHGGAAAHTGSPGRAAASGRAAAPARPASPPAATAAAAAAAAGGATAGAAAGPGPGAGPAPVAGCRGGGGGSPVAFAQPNGDVAAGPPP